MNVQELITTVELCGFVLAFIALIAQAIAALRSEREKLRDDHTRDHR